MPASRVSRLATSERSRDGVRSDEQSTIAVDLPRWLRLARPRARRRSASPADAEVSLIFVDEEAITDLNGRFLGGDGPTDVLAFPIDDDHVPERAPTRRRGPRARVRRPSRSTRRSCSATSSSARRSPRRQAPEHAGTLDDELALLVVHGVLHLLNYDHADDHEAASMQRRERELLDRFRQLEGGPEGRSR